MSPGSLSRVGDIGEESGAGELRWQSGLPRAGTLEPMFSPPPWMTLPLAGWAVSSLELGLLSPNRGPWRRSDCEPGGTGSTWVFFLVIVDLWISLENCFFPLATVRAVSSDLCVKKEGTPEGGRALPALPG